MHIVRPTPQRVLSRTFLIISLTLFLLITAPLIAAAESDGLQALRQLGKAFTDVAEKASPAVVWITSEKEVALRRGSPFDDRMDPFSDDFFEFFFGPRYRDRQQREPAPKQKAMAQGSGFIISKDGYILTNNHVIEGADEIKVKLADEREFQAKVIGTDPDSEVAVVKIDANDLPILELGDSDALDVGEWVLAIGNPFNLSHTVTAGIVSAKKRSRVGITEYEDFIQTDAAINPGNSGGPLINLDGKAVGINTAIVSSGGRAANLGIGFAIPINMVKGIYKELVEQGSVVRGFIGIVYVELTPELAKAFDLDEDTKGVVISQILADSAAEKAGLKHNDVIIEFENEKIEKSETFRNKVAQLKPGTEVKIVVLRGDKEKTFQLKLGEKPGTKQIAQAEAQILEKIGISVQNLTEDLAQRFGYEGLEGVIVSDVEAGSLAAQGGVRAGALIIEVNKEPVENTKEFKKAIEKAIEQGQILLLMKDGQYSRYVVLSIPEK